MENIPKIYELHFFQTVMKYERNGSRAKLVQCVTCDVNGLFILHAAHGPIVSAKRNLLNTCNLNISY